MDVGGEGGFKEIITQEKLAGNLGYLLRRVGREVRKQLLFLIGGGWGEQQDGVLRILLSWRAHSSLTAMLVWSARDPGVPDSSHEWGHGWQLRG